MENIPIVPLYLAQERPVVKRDGTYIMVDDDRMQLEPNEKIENKVDNNISNHYHRNIINIYHVRTVLF